MKSMGSMKRDPSWWTDKHSLAWERVKEALERDWQQTKADLTKTGGQKLNQGVGDTVRQSVGAAPIPPLGTTTHPTTPKVLANEANKALEIMEVETERADESISHAYAEIAKQHLELSETVGAARKELAAADTTASKALEVAHSKARSRVAAAKEKADERIEKCLAKIEEVLLEWHDAKREVRYGYSVRSQYPANHVWNSQLEEKLQREWDGLDTGRSWKLARTGIRCGWEYVAKPWMKASWFVRAPPTDDMRIQSMGKTMKMYEFIEARKPAILTACLIKLRDVRQGQEQAEADLLNDLPHFIDGFVGVLRRDDGVGVSETGPESSNRKHVEA